MGLHREHRLDTELNRLLDDLARPEHEKAADVPGKRTRVEQLLEQLTAQTLADHASAGPGRRTLVERLVGLAGPLRFNDFRVLALRDALGAIGNRGQLRAATLAAADRDVAWRATPPGRTTHRPRTAEAEPGPGGQAMWHAVERRAATLYRHASEAGAVAAEDAASRDAVDAALARAGAGAPLPAALRRRMEDELGVRLDRVRVHTDSVAADAARALRAEAFTIGEDIFFADSAYAPDSRTGQKLIAHELAHVAQSAHGRTADAGEARRVSQPDDPLEREADAVAERFDQNFDQNFGQNFGQNFDQNFDQNFSPRSDQRVDRSNGRTADTEAGAAAPAPVKRRRRRGDVSLAEPSRGAEPLRNTSPATPATAAVQRKPQDPRPAPRTTDPTAQLPNVQQTSRRTPTISNRGTDPNAAFNKAIDSAHKGMKNALAPLKTGIADAKKAPVGAKGKASQQHVTGVLDDHKQTETDRKKKADAAAAHHKSAKHDVGLPDVPPPPRPNPNSPIQFKKVSDWNKYLPPPMKDEDAREKKRLLALVQNKILGEQVESQKILGALYDKQKAQAAELRKMKAGLQAKVAKAQATALAQVASAEAAQAGAVAAAYSAAKGKVNAAAGAAKAQVNAAYSAAVGQINSAYSNNSSKLQSSSSTATSDITTAEGSQIVAVDAAYSGARASVSSAASSEASHARGLGDSVSLPYSGDKLKAAKDAAHKVADGWANDIPGKMQADAESNLFSHQPDSERGVHGYADQQRGVVTTLYGQLKSSLDTSHSQSLSGAAQARSQALQQIDSMAASTCASLSAQSAAQVASVHSQASSARAGIIKAGQAGQASVASACDQSAGGLDKGAQAVVDGAKSVEAPDPTYTAKALEQGDKLVHDSATTVIASLNKTADQTGQGLIAQAADTAKSLAGIAASAKQSADAAAEGAAQSMQQAGQGAAQSLQKMAQGFVQSSNKTGEFGDQHFKQTATDTKTNFAKSLTDLQTGITGTVGQIQSGYSSCIDQQEPPQIQSEAKKAADQVKPWWKKALAVVLTVLVVVVIMVVVTVLTAGIATGPMAIVVGVVAGAAAGAASSIASQVVNNLVMGEKWNNIDWKSVGYAAIAGAVTGGICAGAGVYGGAAVKAAMEGASGWAPTAIRFGVNVVSAEAGDMTSAGIKFLVTGEFEFDVKSLVTNIVVSGVMSNAKVVGVQNKIGDGVRAKFNKPPIHGGEGGEGGEGTGGGEIKPDIDVKAPGEGASGGKGGKPPESFDPTPDLPKTNPGGGKHAAPEPTPAPSGGGKHAAPEPTPEPAPSSGGKHAAPDDGASGGKHAAPDDGAGGKHAAPDDGAGGKHAAPDDGAGGKHAAPDDGAGGKHAAPDDGAGGKHAAPDDGAGGKHAAPDDGAGGKHAAPDDGAGGKHAAPDNGAPGGKHAAPDDHAPTPAQQAHDNARDTAMESDGYAPGTREKANETGDKLAGGQKPAKDGLRDTEANARGKDELDKLKDPRISPEDRAKVDEDLGNRTKSKPDPTGKLDDDIKASMDKVAAENKAKADAKGGDKASDPSKPKLPDPDPASGLTPEKVDEIIGTKKPNRPDPTTYLDPAYVKAQLAKFKGGATRFIAEQQLKDYGIGHRDGTSFVMPTEEVDALMAATHGDPRKLEEALGLPAGQLDASPTVRVDIPNPEKYGLRLPSGNEAGANDFWFPGGKLPTGVSEGVIDGKGLLPGTDFKVTPVKATPAHVDPVKAPGVDPAHAKAPTTDPKAPTTDPKAPTTDPKAPAPKDPAIPTAKDPTVPTAKDPAAPTAKDPAAPTAKDPAAPTTKGGGSDKGGSDKGGSDKGGSDKGGSDKGPPDKDPPSSGKTGSDPEPLPKSWDKFNASNNDQFKARLKEFRGSDNVTPDYSGGEGRVFTKDGEEIALKRWYESRLGDMPTSLAKLKDVRADVEANPKLSADIDVVKIHEEGPDWILRDFDPNSVELKSAPAEAQAARQRAISELEAKRANGGLSAMEKDLLKKLAKNPPSANLHWSPTKHKIVVIDMQ